MTKFNKHLSEELIWNIFLNNTSKQALYKAFNIQLNQNAINLDNDLLYYLELIGFNTREDISLKNLNKVRNEILLKKYNGNPKICPICGNIIPYKKRNNICCSSSCGATYSNKNRGKLSEETKQKIRTTLLKKYYNGELLSHNIIDVENGIKYRICTICNKKFKVPRKKSGAFSATKTCSDECHKKLKLLKGKESAARIIAEGRHKGWQSRNIISYAERFWIKVLDNNNIPYTREYHLNNKYFLDFLIEKNGKKIDLEIDGKQHKYLDRIEHDKIRDEYVTSEGYIVYRIPWNRMTGKQEESEETKNKIDNFLDFYKNL